MLFLHQCCGSASASNKNPDPHLSDKLDPEPDPHQLQMTSQNVWNMILFLALFQWFEPFFLVTRIWIRIRIRILIRVKKVESDPHQIKSELDLHQGDASNPDPHPDPH
jgi:hypothetical protein